MVLNCVVVGCNNLQDKRNNISFHLFPWKRPPILEMWIKAVRRENWQPSRTSRICGMHFRNTDYQIRPGASVKLLKPDAVPSIFPYPKHLQIIPSTRRVLKRLMADDKVDKTVDVTEANLCSVEEKEATNEKSTQTTTAICKQNLKLRRKIRTLKQKLRRRDLKMKNMIDLINELKKNDFSSENLESVLENYFGGANKKNS